MNFAVSITTSFGQISMNFESVKEFEDNFPNLETIKKTVEGSTLMLGIVRTPMPGFEDIYRLTAEGLVELIWYPDSAAKTIALAILAYGPRGATENEIHLSTGVENAPSTYFGQTTYKEYFTKYPDKNSEKAYGLTPKGKLWVQKETQAKRKQVAPATGKAETPSSEPK